MNYYMLFCLLFVVNGRIVLSDEIRNLISKVYKPGSRLENIENLDIELQQYFFINTTYIDIENITTLDLTSSNNLFQRTIPQLRAVRLTNSKNIIIKENAFHGTRNLVYLTISDTPWEEVEANTFQALYNLRYLNIESNKIKTLHNGSFANLEKLEILDLTSNKLNQLPANIFKELSHLTYLSLSKNQIDSIDNNAFYGLESLTTLKLNNNNLKIIEANTLNVLNKLNLLILSHNSISYISGDLNLEKLNILELSRNNLEEITDRVFSKCVELTQVYLQENRLKGLTKAPFLSLSKVKTLNVSGNNITDSELLDFVRDKYDVFMTPVV